MIHLPVRVMRPNLPLEYFDSHDVVTLLTLTTCPNIPPQVYYWWCIYVIPVRSLTDRDYTPQVKFIIFRFHNNAWWWGGVFILRAVCITACILFNADKPYRQVVLLGLIVLLFLVVQVAVWPWRTVAMNRLDAVVSFAVFGMVASAAPLAAHRSISGGVDPTVKSQVGILCQSFWMLAVLLNCGYLLFKVFEFLYLDYFSKWCCPNGIPLPCLTEGGLLEGLGIFACLKTRRQRKEKLERKQGLMTDRTLRVVKGIEGLSADENMRNGKIRKFIECLNEVGTRICGRRSAVD